MDPKVRQSWEEFLNPEVTRPRLIAASIYIAGFEALKDSVVGRIPSFFWTGFDASGDKIDPKYQSDVLARNRSPFYASLDWLKEMDAIDDGDEAVFDRVKLCRNTLAHKLFTALGSEGLPPDFDQCFGDMVALLRKIEVWWITNVEIPTNPDYDGSELDEDGIVPGPVMGMQLLMDIALGDEERRDERVRSRCLCTAQKHIGALVPPIKEKARVEKRLGQFVTVSGEGPVPGASSPTNPFDVQLGRAVSVRPSNCKQARLVYGDPTHRQVVCGHRSLDSEGYPPAGVRCGGRAAFRNRVCGGSRSSRSRERIREEPTSARSASGATGGAAPCVASTSKRDTASRPRATYRCTTWYRSQK